MTLFLKRASLLISVFIMLEAHFQIYSPSLYIISFFLNRTLKKFFKSFTRDMNRVKTLYIFLKYNFLFKKFFYFYASERILYNIYKSRFIVNELHVVKRKLPRKTFHAELSIHSMLYTY